MYLVKIKNKPKLRECSIRITNNVYVIKSLSRKDIECYIEDENVVEFYKLNRKSLVPLKVKRNSIFKGVIL